MRLAIYYVLSVLLASAMLVGGLVWVASPAFALNCKAAKEVVLDFDTGTGDKPLLNTDPVPVAETCVVGPYGTTTFTLKGMEGKYDSPADALKAFQAVRFLKSKGVKPLDMGSMFKFVEQKQNQAAAADKVVEKK